MADFWPVQETGRLDLLSSDKLNYLSEDDRIQLAILEHKALMRKKEGYVNQVHKYKISDIGKDGRYHTSIVIDGKMHRLAKINRIVKIIIGIAQKKLLIPKSVLYQMMSSNASKARLKKIMRISPILLRCMR